MIGINIEILKIIYNDIVYMIIKISSSPLKTKRYRVYMDTGKHYDFGLKGGYTYIDGRTKNERINYRARHMANDTEYKLIDNLVPSPALFSYYLLWGPYDNLDKNIDHLNSLWKSNHKLQK
jgi:hypothetical protein